MDVPEHRNLQLAISEPIMPNKNQIFDGAQAILCDNFRREALGRKSFL